MSSARCCRPLSDSASVKTKLPGLPTAPRLEPSGHLVLATRGLERGAEELAGQHSQGARAACGSHPRLRIKKFRSGILIFVEVSLEWEPPADCGGAPVASYEAMPRLDAKLTELALPGRSSETAPSSTSTRPLIS